MVNFTSISVILGLVIALIGLFIMIAGSYIKGVLTFVVAGAFIGAPFAYRFFTQVSSATSATSATSALDYGD